MIVMNTTFHVENALVEPFLTWVREVYLPSARAVEGMGRPVLMRLLLEVDPQATSFAVQLTAPTRQLARTWHDTEGAALRQQLCERWPQRVVFFTTYMETMNL